MFDKKTADSIKKNILKEMDYEDGIDTSFIDQISVMSQLCLALIEVMVKKKLLTRKDVEDELAKIEKETNKIASDKDIKKAFTKKMVVDQQEYKNQNRYIG